MFTRLAKGLLWVLVVATAITALVVGGTDAGFLGFLGVLLLGALVLLFLGMFVELANNVMDIKQLLEKIDYSTQQIGTDYQTDTQFSAGMAQTSMGTWYCRKCGTQNSGNEARCTGCGAYAENKIGATTYNLSRLAAQAEMEKQQSFEGWYCRQCGEKNSLHSAYCKNCGQYK